MKVELMRINKAGEELIKQFEGLSLTAYPDIGGVLTIGYGHTRGVTPGMRITQEEAEAWLQERLRFFEAGVTGLLCVPPSENEFAALVSFAYNLGLGSLQKSTLLKKFNDLDIQGAANEFPRWNHLNGREIPGLTRRRMAERKLFLTEDT